MWFVFSVAATWEPWKPGGLRRPGRWPLIPHDGDDARDGGEGGTARLPFALLIRHKSAAGSCQGLLGDGPTERCKDLSHCLGRLGV